MTATQTVLTTQNTQARFNGEILHHINVTFTFTTKPAHNKQITKTNQAEARLTDMAEQWQRHADTTLTEKQNNGWDSYVNAWMQAKDPSIKFNVESGMHSTEKHYNATKKDGTLNSGRALRLDDVGDEADDPCESNDIYNSFASAWSTNQTNRDVASNWIINYDLSQIDSTAVKAIMELNMEDYTRLDETTLEWLYGLRRDILDCATNNQKPIVKMIYFGMKVKDIAKELGKTDKAIYASISSVCNRTVKYLQKV